MTLTLLQPGFDTPFSANQPASRIIILAPHLFSKNVPSGTPADMKVQGKDTYVFSPEVTGLARSDLFAHVALTQAEVYSNPHFRTYFERISSEDAGQFRFDFYDFAINGAFFPTQPLDALKLGVAMYDPDEDLTKDFMVARISEIIERGAKIESAQAAGKSFFGFGKKNQIDPKTMTEATQFMAKEHRTLCNFKKLALQEGGIPGANVAKGETLLVFSNKDPRNPAHKSKYLAQLQRQG
jgi:hypothetical protein